MLTEQQLKDLQTVYDNGFTEQWFIDDTALDVTNDPEENQKLRDCYRGISMKGHTAFMEAVVRFNSEQEDSDWLRANLDWVIEARRAFPDLVEMAKGFLVLKQALPAILAELPLTPAQRALLTIGGLL